MKKVRVSLKLSKTHCISVGTLAGDNKEKFFEFDKDFLSSPFNLSPLQLEKNTGVMTLKSPAHLSGLWGVFHDSLPDGWGLILMDRYFRKQNINIFEVSLLDRLLFIGDRGSGALVYEPSLDLRNGAEKFLDIQKLSAESQKILAGTAKELLPELLRAGGSPAGARPKIFVGLDKDNNVISGAEELPASFEHWIVKFNSKSDIEDAGAIEYAYAQMASIAGVEMSETKLILAGNERFFATKRFDRFGSDRYHLHTFANMIGADFRIPATDYADLMSAAYAVTKSNEDLQKIFRLMVFNIVSHNRDDHSKNFSFLMDHSGGWRFAPSYDLTFSTGPGGEHSNTVKGEGKNPSLEHVKKIADDFGLKSSFVNEVLDQTAWAISQWSLLCADLDVSKKTAQSIQKHFQNL